MCRFAAGGQTGLQRLIFSGFGRLDLDLDWSCSAQATSFRCDVSLAPAPILCSDTTVAMGRTIYGKPDDEGDARRMLGELAGHTHRVLTAVAVQQGRKRFEALSESRVSFCSLTPARIRAYVATGEPLGKAGAYAVQGQAATFIARIAGSYSGIMGLPVFETAMLLRQLGFKC